MEKADKQRNQNLLGGSFQKKVIFYNSFNESLKKESSKSIVLLFF